MKNLIAITAIFACGISFNPVNASELDDIARNYITDNDMVCDSVSHVEIVTEGNSIYYDITCEQESGFTIFKIIPFQVVMTHYLEK